MTTKIKLGEDIVEVEITTPVDKEVLSYDSASGKWKNQAATGGHTIEDEGTPLTQRTKLNFVGAVVTVTDDAVNDRTIVTITSVGGGHTIEDEGTPLTQRSNLNFTGAGVTVTDDAGNDASVINVPSVVAPNMIYLHMNFR